MVIIGVYILLILALAVLSLGRFCSLEQVLAPVAAAELRRHPFLRMALCGLAIRLPAGFLQCAPSRSPPVADESRRRRPDVDEGQRRR